MQIKDLYLGFADEAALGLISGANSGCQDLWYSSEKTRLANIFQQHGLKIKEEFILFSVARPLFFRISATVTTVPIAEIKRDDQIISISSDEIVSPSLSSIRFLYSQFRLITKQANNTTRKTKFKHNISIKEQKIKTRNNVPHSSELEIMILDHRI